MEVTLTELPRPAADQRRPPVSEGPGDRPARPSVWRYVLAAGAVPFEELMRPCGVIGSDEFFSPRMLRESV